MCEACYRGDVRALLDLLNSPRNPNARNEEGDTPMHIAATFGHFDMVQWLIHAGAEIDAWDPEGQMPIHSAADGGHLDIVRFFLTMGVDIDQPDRVDGSTPLSRAAGSGHVESVRFLLAGPTRIIHVQMMGQLHCTLQATRGTWRLFACYFKLVLEPISSCMTARRRCIFPLKRAILKSSGWWNLLRMVALS